MSGMVVVLAAYIYFICLHYLPDVFMPELMDNIFFPVIGLALLLIYIAAITATAAIIIPCHKKSRCLSEKRGRTFYIMIRLSELGAIVGIIGLGLDWVLGKPAWLFQASLPLFYISFLILWIHLGFAYRKKAKTIANCVMRIKEL